MEIEFRRDASYIEFHKKNELEKKVERGPKELAMRLSKHALSKHVEGIPRTLLKVNRT